METTQAEPKSNMFKTLLTIVFTILAIVALVFAVVKTRFDIKTTFDKLLGVVATKEVNPTPTPENPYLKKEDNNKVSSTSPSKNTTYVVGNTAAPRVLGTTAPPKNIIVVATNTPTPTPTPTPMQTQVSTIKTTTDTKKPVVEITNPEDGSRVNTDSDVYITAYISDNEGVTKVRYYINNDLECEDKSEPFITKCVWNVPSKDDKKYTLTVKAYDAAGNVGENSVTVRSND